MIPGIPLSYAGSFATVYKILSPTGQAWAVKCFTRKVENLQQRYQEISKHLNRRKRRFVVDFQYLREGIKVEGEWYPAVKMQWVEGFTLNAFLRDHVHNSDVLEQLCQLWLRLANDMREDRMAHGDLQHGNVMLVPGNSADSMFLRLVDYDGMWVPALADRPPREVGHANYQHPQRLAEGGHTAEIDRFAHLAIYTALRCLMAGGKVLWSAHDNEENLLFREADFRSPGKSKLFAKLLALPDADAAALAGHLLLASQGPLDQVPFVGDLLDGSDVEPLSSEQIKRLCALVPQVVLTVPPPAALSTPPPGPVDWFLPEADATALHPAIAPRPTAIDMPTLRDTSRLVEIAGEEQLRAAEELYLHAREILRRGDPSYALQLLLSCCKLDPGNIAHRELLRLTSRATASRQPPGWMDSLSNRSARSRLRSARRAGEHRKVLEYGEELLLRMPADVSVQLDMAESAEALGLYAMATWLLEEARRQSSRSKLIDQTLARLAQRLDRLGIASAVEAHLRQAKPVERMTRSSSPEPMSEAIDPAPCVSATDSETNIVFDGPDPQVGTQEQRQGAAALHARAVEVMGNGGDPAYAHQLLLSCCKLDPARVEYRKTLREVGRLVPHGNPAGWLTSLSNLSAQALAVRPPGERPPQGARVRGRDADPPAR